jgi:hypothetical protein
VYSVEIVYNVVTRQLKARILEGVEVITARQWHGKHVSAATRQHTATIELLEAVFSVCPM